MKKLATIILMALLCSNLYAQPVLVRDSIIIGSTFNVSTATNFNPLVLLANGANTTWDISAATVTPLGTAAMLGINSTPYAGQYPAANFAIKFTVSGNDIYSLFNLTTSVMEEVGNNVSIGGGVPFIDYRTALVFPFTFTQSSTDSYQKTGQGTKTVINKYDGYGTFITPSATFTNVVRILTIDNGDTAVNFWQSSSKGPLFTANNNGFTLWTASGVTGIEDKQVNNQFSISPNPATNQLDIISNQRMAKVEVFNLQGQLQLFSEESVVDIAELQPGIYFIKRYTEDGTSTRKFIKQ